MSTNGEAVLGAPMFHRERPFRFHIELTDKCNAACPMCQRTLETERCATNRTKVRNIDLSLDDFLRAFPPEFCRQVERIDFCGGLGDPPAARECLAICDYLTAHDVQVTISSNGGLRNTRWWRRLGETFRRNDSYMEFHIDGLADTNHLYRVNTRFDVILENVKAYLATGAQAEWHFIVFRHNEHQVEAAHALSRELGFRSFKVIDTIRFGAAQRFDYQMPDGSWHVLEPARGSAQSKPPPGVEVTLPSADAVNGIRCKSALQNRPYITADGTVSACCWITGSPDERARHHEVGLDVAKRTVKLEDLQHILFAEPYTSGYRKAWLGGASPICERKCGQNRRSTSRTL